MPRRTARTFRVRHYECDAYGHLNNAVYLRYMQETAFEATAEAGYSYFDYMDMGVAWLAHETVITYHLPVRIYQDVDVTTWVADFGKVRSRRMYRMTLSGTDTLVAEGHTDWVYVDLSSGRPTPIPEALTEAFLPEGLPAERIHHERFPPPPASPPRSYIHNYLVEWRDIDTMWHVNNANYFSYMETAGGEAAASLGWPFTRLQKELNLGVFVQSYHIVYDGAAELGDRLNITTFISDMRRSSGTRHFLITREKDGAPVCRARLRFAFVDLETGRPAPLPDRVRADFDGHIVE